jgi:hypothetical protein
MPVLEALETELVDVGIPARTQLRDLTPSDDNDDLWKASSPDVG